MPDFIDVVTSADVQAALESLQRACMGPDGDFAGVDELVITQSIFAGFSHRYSDVRTGNAWTFTTQGIPRSELAWLKDLKAKAFRPGVGSWITAQVHVFPVASGFVEVFDQEIVAAGGMGGMTEPRCTVEVLTSELKAFPRTVDNIPQWMWDILRAEGITPPVYNPSLKTVDWDNRRLPVTDAGTDFSAEPVIIDPSQEPGFFSKIGQKLFGS